MEETNVLERYAVAYDGSEGDKFKMANGKRAPGVSNLELSQAFQNQTGRFAKSEVSSSSEFCGCAPPPAVRSFPEHHDRADPECRRYI